MKELYYKLLLLSCLLFSLRAFSALPQNNWYKYSEWPVDTPISSAISDANEIYIGQAGSNTQIDVFNLDGTHIRTLPFIFAQSISIDEAGSRIVVADGGFGQIQIFDDTTGNLQASWFPSNPAGFHYRAVFHNGEIYSSDSNLNVVYVYDMVGNLNRTFTAGINGLPAQFEPRMIAIDEKKGRLLIENRANPRSVVACDLQGNYIETINHDADGVIDVSSGNLIMLYDTILTDDGTQIPHPFPGTSNTTSTFSKDGFIITGNTDDDLIRVFKIGYRTMGSLPEQLIPLPAILSISQRANSGLVDIDYRITDRDSPTLETAICAFQNGAASLNNFIPLSTFVENTATNIGAGTPSNTDLRITWDATADLNSGLSQLNFSVFANDGRDLLDLHLIVIPANSPTPALTISRSPISEPEMLPVWFWLLAKGDANVVLANGEVKGTSGTYNGQILAQGTTTTALGRAFIFEQLNVRAATAAEVQQAREGTTPSNVNTFTPRNRIGALPDKINELGFDTGTYPASSIWIVPLP